MAFYERIRDVVSAPLRPETLRERESAGWQMVAIEWRREVPETETAFGTTHAEAIPYGLRLSDDGTRLEPDAGEYATLLQIMELLGEDFSYASIVSDLNERGLRTREGLPWDRVAVFKLMPRLIEVAPRLFASDAWKQRQEHAVR